MSGKTKRDWGCLHWFILGFIIFALIVTLIVMVAAPSGGGQCQSLVNQGPIQPLQGAGRSNEQPLVRLIVLSSPPSVKSVGSDVHHIASKPRPVTPPKGGATVKVKPPVYSKAPTKPSKAPTGPSGGLKVDLDIDDCD